MKVRDRRWLAFHKPLGVVTTAKDEEGRRTVLDFIPDPTALTYVGRLDVMTTGLLLLTTDGEAVHRLTHPRYHIPRRYTALVHGRPAAEIAKAVRERVVIDGRPVVPQRGQGSPRHRGPEHSGPDPGRRDGTGSSGAGVRRWGSRLTGWPGSPTGRYAWAICRPAAIAP